LEVKLSTRKEKLYFFGLCTSKEERVEENEKVYNQLQERLNKSNINDYILLPGDLKASRGNTEVYSIVGSFVEPVTSTNGLKLRDFATHNNIKITNSFYSHPNMRTHIHTQGQLAIPKQL